jgi:hypothetical protein
MRNKGADINKNIIKNPTTSTTKLRTKKEKTKRKKGTYGLEILLGIPLLVSW